MTSEDEMLLRAKFNGARRPPALSSRAHSRYTYMQRVPTPCPHRAEFAELAALVPGVWLEKILVLKLTVKSTHS